MLNRRELLNLAAGAGAVSFTGHRSVGEQPTEPGKLPLIDTHISLFRYPFRRLPLDHLPKMLAKMRDLGIRQAWAGSFEALLQRDISGVNRRLAAACQPHSELVPIGAINLQFPGWRDEFRRCCEQLEMPGIRLLPNYHGYTLDDPRFQKLLDLAARAGTLVQIVAALEDTRTQHPLVRAADVDLAPLVEALQSVPEARVQVLNYRPRLPLIEKLAELDNLSFDTARVDGTNGVADLVAAVSKERVMLGSHAPFLIPEAALIRLHESGTLDWETLSRLCSGNAERLLRKQPA